MSILYWITSAVSVIAFGGMSKHGRYYTVLDRVWVPLYLVSGISAIILSGSIILGTITGLVLLFGNGLFWGIIWTDRKAIKRLQQIINKNNLKDN